MGKDAGNFVRKKINAHNLIDQYVESNDRGWKSKVYSNEKGQFVIIAPHPGRANWINSNSDPSPLIAKYLD